MNVVCSTCEIERRHYGKGLCKSCYCRAWKKANAERVRATKRAWHAANADQVNARRRTREQALIASDRFNRCSNGCDQPVIAHALCEHCYDQWYYAENREHRRAQQAAWEAANRAHVRRKQRERVAALSPEQRARESARLKAYAQRNRVRLAERSRGRQARKIRATVGRITRRDIDRLIHRFHGCCAYCGASWEHLDHVVPLARGGPHSIGNLVPACAPCNLSKNSALVVEWKFRDRIAA